MASRSLHRQEYLCKDPQCHVGVVQSCLQVRVMRPKSYSTCASEDVKHILRRYFPARDIAEIKERSRSTRQEQQQLILKLFDYRLCTAAAKEDLERKAQRTAMLSAQPIFILREALQYLTHQRIVTPGYTYLQDMVGQTVSGELQRMTGLLSQSLTPEVEQQLKAL